ncbi:MAG: hypothetical protein ACK553_01500 [Planctomycetota bacterium]
MVFPIRFMFSLWPGWLVAWRHGDLRSLLIAILFGCLLCISWIGTTIWPLWLSPWRLMLLWSVAGVGAILSLVHNASCGLLASRSSRRGCPDDALILAQAFYLQANYYEAERSIAPYCLAGAMDAEAALLMASVLRRTGRFSQALALLDELALLDCGLPWLEEIERERKLSRLQKVRSHADSL